jgi:hypothetical protein
LARVTSSFAQAAATAGLLVTLLPQLGLRVDSPVASNLLAGIVTDTIGFRVPGVGSGLLRQAADLFADAGAETGQRAGDTLGAGDGELGSTVRRERVGGHADATTHPGLVEDLFVGCRPATPADRFQPLGEGVDRFVGRTGTAGLVEDLLHVGGASELAASSSALRGEADATDVADRVEGDVSDETDGTVGPLVAGEISEQLADPVLGVLELVHVGPGVVFGGLQLLAGDPFGELFHAECDGTTAVVEHFERLE